MATKTVALEIKRQASPDAPSVVGELRAAMAPRHERHLRHDGDRRQPGHRRRRATPRPLPTTRIAWKKSAGHARCASTAKPAWPAPRWSTISNSPSRLEPLSKFPLVRDLQVDRSVLFENLKAVKAWVPIDGTYDLGLRPARLPAAAGSQLPALQLHHCCCCMEVCPQFNEDTGFVGAATIAQVKLFNDHPTGKVSRKSVCAPSPATAAFRSAASRRTAWKSAPRAFRSPTPSPTSAATC